MSVPEPDDERVRADLESRLLQEEIEAASEQLHRNTRSLGELLLDWGDAGHQVRVAVGTEAWAGDVITVSEKQGSGVLALRVGAIRVEIDLAAVDTIEQLLSRTEHPPAGDEWMPASLVARLRWCLAQDPVPAAVIGGRDLALLAGTVAAVAPAHIELMRDDGAVLALDLARVGFVIIHRSAG